MALRPTRRQFLSFTIVIGKQERGVDVFPVSVAPGAEDCFHDLAHGVWMASDGAARLVRSRATAVAELGRVQHGARPCGAPLDLFAGFAFGMDSAALATWIGSAEGSWIWREAHAGLGYEAYACGTASVPGTFHSPRPLSRLEDLRGLHVRCGTRGVMAAAWRSLGALPTDGGEGACLPMTTGCGGAHGALLRTLSPSFGTAIALRVSSQALPGLAPGVRRAVARVCGAMLARSAAACVPVPVCRPPPLPAEIAAAVAGATAHALRDALAGPDAVRLGAAERYAEARLRGVSPAPRDLAAPAWLTG